MRCDPSVEPNRMTWRAFIDEFVHETKSDSGTRYCFVLGAGASRDSGIRTAGELAMEWLRQNHTTRGIEQPFEKWIETLEFPLPEDPDTVRNFDPKKAAEFYFDVYDLYCAGDPQKGYRALNDEIEGKEPSFGYSVLANILSETQNRVVVTVNFDNLVADALFMFSGKTPLVCPHESLARFIPSIPTRPVVAKIHRDRFYDPKSGRQAVTELEDAWKVTLNALFHNYKPIFIGYGGNDRSLMTFLEEADHNLLPNGYFWLVYDPQLANPSLPESCLPENVTNLIQKHPGNWVPSYGFDSLMILLHSGLGYPFLHEQIIDKAAKRQKIYMDSVQQLCAIHKLESPAAKDADPVGTALSSSIEKSGWLAWWLKAKQVDSLNEKLSILNEGLGEIPESPELYNNRGTVYSDNSEYDLAIADYTKAIELDPKCAYYYYNRGNSYDERGELDLAIADYDKSIELDPNDASTFNNRGTTHSRKGDLEKAVADHTQAIKLDSKNASYFYNRGNSYYRKRERFQAIADYTQAIRLNPEYAKAYCNRSSTYFLVDRRDDGYRDLAEAIRLDPEHRENAKTASGFDCVRNELRFQELIYGEKPPTKKRTRKVAK